MTYRITVKTVTDKVIHFKHVHEYNVEDGFLIFIDNKTKQTKRFAVPNCEIEEEQSQNG